MYFLIVLNKDFSFRACPRVKLWLEVLCSLAVSGFFWGKSVSYLSEQTF